MFECANKYPNITINFKLEIFNLLHTKHYPCCETESRNVAKFIQI